MPAPTHARRYDASMSLLTNLMDHSLDEGYAEAAARRPATDAPRDWRRPGWLLLAGLLAVGLLLSTAAAQARDRASSTAEARTALVGEIRDRNAANDRVEKSLEGNRADVAATRRKALRLTAEGTRLAARLATLEVMTGASPVTDRHWSCTCSDAPSGDDGDADNRPAHRQRDRRPDHRPRSADRRQRGVGVGRRGSGCQRATTHCAERDQVSRRRHPGRLPPAVAAVRHRGHRHAQATCARASSKGSAAAIFRRCATMASTIR